METLLALLALLDLLVDPLVLMEAGSLVATLEVALLDLLALLALLEATHMA